MSLADEFDRVGSDKLSIGLKDKPEPEITPLPAGRQSEFAEWLKQNAIGDLDSSGSHYDYRGAFLAGVNRDASGHFPDTFKQHGHPTFSVESKYSTGPEDGGRWNGETFIPRKGK